MGRQIAPVTSEQEISAIEGALRNTDRLAPVRCHLETALSLFANREKPEYRNSVKESISAVEAFCKLIAHNPKATLGNALDGIEAKGTVRLHPALKKGFDSIYGYTSDADGIRHALLNEPTVDSEDARFMLVSCSAFINYLVEKSVKAGVDLRR